MCGACFQGGSAGRVRGPDRVRALLVFVKDPVPGRVKTRLCPPLSPVQAALLYGAMMRDSVDRFSRIEGVRVLLMAEPPLGGLASSPPGGHPLLEQRGEDLGGRLTDAFGRAFASGFTAVAAVGSDHPTLPLSHIQTAFRLLESGSPCVLGPAEDGGYCLVGLSRPLPEIFRGIDWSTARVLDQTEARLSGLGLRAGRLDPWYDVDTVQDLRRLRADLAAPLEGLSRTREALRSLPGGQEP